MQRDRGEGRRPKPAGSTWTDEQWQAITYRGGNVLVAAGAGSGKTSVLVERILQQIMDRENPVEIDRLLVVTFTNAAAAEMKLRIGAALEKALQENPRLSFLRRQLLFLNKASISTVHSFCLQVIRRYYYLRDLDPSFRILEETEADLLQQEVLEEVLETYYAKEEAESLFYRLVDIYSSDRGDRALSELVLRLYSFSRSHLRPDLWLRKQAAAFAVEDAEALEKTPWVRETLLHCRRELAGIRGRLQEALALIQMPGGPEPYSANLQEELAVLQQIEAAAQHSWAELAAAMQVKVFGRLKACSGEKYNQSLKESVQQRRDECKKEMQRLKEAFFQRSLEEQAAELQALAPLLQFLVEIVQSFAREYRRAKEERGALDFADLEHYALQILSRPERDRRDRSDADRFDGDSFGGDLLPSEAALKYREQFEEVLIDEYQDINPVQEAILKLVSLPGPEPAGNRFMVGDVKQSIYRFRLAAPELFLEKYHAYIAGTQPGRCLILRHNFRSRREILAGVNFLFRRIMDEVVGEMEYDREARLRYGATYYPLDRPAGKSGAGGKGMEAQPVGRAVEVLFVTRTAVETGEAADGKANQGKNPASPGGGDWEAGDDGRQQTGEEIPFEISRAAAAEEELDRAALEGRLMARRIKELCGAGGREPFFVFDRETKGMRPATYRDIAILLRTAQNWAIPIMEELRRAGIPVYAELGTGYFEATEVEVMLSLLKVIDNPYQEIPLAAVLRSPLVGLNAEELAQIRAAAPGADYYEALKTYCAVEAEQGHDDPSCQSVESNRDISSLPVETGRAHDHGSGHEHDREHGQNPVRDPSSLFARLSLFRQNLQRWREEARQGSLAGLIWQIYRDTGYYDLAGGMPGGDQRQANLRALYDRARQYEATSLRGLFRFLRFIERLRERGGDLGVARALGEEEDVVRISTVHKGKGLEFPIVFVAGLSKQFNRQDLQQDFLLHKSLGFGPRYIEAALRLVYPTLPWLAIRNRLNLELLAEEMRILYVALTRAKEKLFLVATVGDIAAEAVRWAMRSAPGEMLLPDYDRRRAQSFLDWLGPALLQHPQAGALRALAGVSGGISYTAEDESGEPSDWKIKIVTAEEAAAEAEGKGREGALQGRWLEEIARLAEVPPGRGIWTGAIDRQLTWRYPFQAAANSSAKVSVSELQRLFAAGMEGEDAREAPWLEISPAGGPRPRFLGEGRLTAAERGTAYHTVMQHLEFSPFPDTDNVRRQLESMVRREILTPEEKEIIDPAAIAAFFNTMLGKRILRAGRVEREIPFSLALPAAEVYPGWTGGTRFADRSCDASPARPGHDFSARPGDLPAAENLEAGPPGAELVLIQGVIDCLAREESGLLLVDYKTDRTTGLTLEMLRERYRLQLEYYAHALKTIRREKITGRYLYFFHGNLVVALDE